MLAVQFTLMASEAWYFVISLDVVADLFLSPFNDVFKRLSFYHLLVWSLACSTAVVLITTYREDGESEAGVSPSFDWCWRRSFADQEQEKSFLGFFYIYGQVIFFYAFSLVVWFLAKLTLSKGIPRTYKARRRSPRGQAEPARGGLGPRERIPSLSPCGGPCLRRCGRSGSSKGRALWSASRSTGPSSAPSTLLSSSAPPVRAAPHPRRATLLLALLYDAALCEVSTTGYRGRRRTSR